MDASANLPPEVNVEPLGDLMLDFLIDRDKEEAFNDYKETISIAKDSAFAKIAKDFFAFSNFGGGYLLLGFRPKEKFSNVAEIKRNYVPVGLPDDFRLDQAALQEKFNAYVDSPMNIQYREFFRTYDGTSKRFGAIYVPGFPSTLKPKKEGVYSDEDGKKRIAFRTGEILFRRGTQSIPASEEEKTWIEKRAKTEGYRISLLSGKPDNIQETLYSNLLEVTRLPEVIWSADPIADYRTHTFPNRPGVAFKFWNDRIVSFADLSDQKGPLANRVVPSSVRDEQLLAWLNDPDKQRIIIELLNREIRLHAERLGMQHEPNKEKFFFSCSGDYRTEAWKPRIKSSSTLKVAQRMWVQQLGKYLYWHIAVVARFTYVGGRLYLTLTPTIQLTDDGRRAIFGAKEGTVITRLTYNRYNSSYLNSILFWAFKLADGKEKIELRGGNIVVKSKPAETAIDVGLLSDRPASEPMQEIPEIEFGEANDVKPV